MHRVLAGVLLIVALPLVLVLSLALLVIQGWPVWFLQKRVGKDGKKFTIYKFRTMERGAEREQKSLWKLNEADGVVFKIKDDPRFTRFGRFLSRTGLDELPQLVNVIKGEMDLVGPRPFPHSEEKRIKKKFKVVRRTVRPGIISTWVLAGQNHSNFEEWMDLDMAYVKNKSVLYDWGLITLGFFYMLRLSSRAIFGR